jgi:hypothetical protein
MRRAWSASKVLRNGGGNAGIGSDRAKAKAPDLRPVRFARQPDVWADAHGARPVAFHAHMQPRFCTVIDVPRLIRSVQSEKALAWSKSDGLLMDRPEPG